MSDTMTASCGTCGRFDTPYCGQCNIAHDMGPDYRVLWVPKDSPLHPNDHQIGGDHYHTCGIQPWEDFKIDEPVMVRNYDYDWVKAYFAGVDENGEPTAYDDGMTSWTAGGCKTYWHQCRKPTPEELSQ